VRRGRDARRLRELAQDVGDVAVHRVLAEHERRRDLPVRHAGRDETEHLRLARGERRPGVDLGGALAVQEAGERAEELAPVVLPRHVRLAGERHEPRVRQQRRELASARDRHGAVASTVEDERRDADMRHHGAQVGVQVELEEDRRGLRGRRLSLHARVALQALAARVRVEQAREHLRREAPVDPGELHERRAHCLRDVVTRGVATEVDDPFDLERVAHGELRRREATAGRGEHRRGPADRVDHRLELPALRLDGRPRLEAAVGEPAADAVEADDPVGARELGVERPLLGVVPLLLEVRDPARADDERRPLAVGGVREAPALEVEVADLLLHGPLR
jgi:hypothetical protein